MHVTLYTGGPRLALADYWQPLRTLPEDPPGSQAFGYAFPGGVTGLVTTFEIPLQHAMPQDQRAVISGLRGAPDVVDGLAGLIDTNTGGTASNVPYVYSLIKVRDEPSGVQYNVTLHLFGERVQQLQGHFMEGETAGVREASVYEMARQAKMLGDPTPDDPSGGWARDPYDGSTTGFVMNMSELPDFDEQFPGHPLSMARELLRSVAAS